MQNHRIYKMSFISVYEALVNKALRKSRTKGEVDELIYWLTGYSQVDLQNCIDREIVYATFFNEAPKLNMKRRNITGVICGVRIENIEEPLMQEIRYLDKLIDELAKGKTIEKIISKYEKD